MVCIIARARVLNDDTREHPGAAPPAGTGYRNHARRRRHRAIFPQFAIGAMLVAILSIVVTTGTRMLVD
jgi:hypothetical protein